ncbi:Uncharacterised protein [uncultured archaeon]|nr:Uncharacterised protein [uncultured archaeon]
MSRNYGALLLVLLIFMVVGPVPAENAAVVNSTQKNLTLNIYLDKEGKAFVDGYVHDVKALSFLKHSQYRYQSNSSHIDAFTDALTHKDGDLWTLKFASSSYLGFDYTHLIFHLPGDVELKNISTSKGLQYFISTSNGTLIVDIHGYGAQDQEVTIKYQQPPTVPPAPAGTQNVQNPQFSTAYPPPPIPLGPAGVQPAQVPGVPIQYLQPTQAANIGNSSPNNLYLILGLCLLLVLGAASVIIAKKTRLFRQPLASDKAKEPLDIEVLKAPATSSDLRLDKAAETVEDSSPVSLTEEDTFAEFVDEDSSAESNPLAQLVGSQPEKIEVSSEMNAIMETLTNNEHVIVQTLIAAGGRMTQAELRHQTEMAKSSLSGILLSLKNRKLINKIEYGHTNVVERSERFLSKKERS